MYDGIQSIESNESSHYYYCYYCHYDPAALGYSYRCPKVVIALFFLCSRNLEMGKKSKVVRGKKKRNVDRPL